MFTIPETRRTEATLSNLLFYAYRRRVADFEECLAKFVAEGGFNLNALNDVAWRTFYTHEDEGTATASRPLPSMYWLVGSNHKNGWRPKTLAKLPTTPKSNGRPGSRGLGGLLRAHPACVTHAGQWAACWYYLGRVLPKFRQETCARCHVRQVVAK